MIIKSPLHHQLPTHRHIPFRNTLHPYFAQQNHGEEEVSTNDNTTNNRKRPPRIHPDLLRIHGSNFHEPAMDGHERLVFQNVRGISRGPVPALELVDAINQTHASICGVAEPNCAMCDDILIPINARLRKEYGTGMVTAC